MGLDREPSRISIKTAAGKRAGARKRAIGWSDVLRGLERDAVRSQALERYRAEGHSPDDFGRLLAARAAMADALTRTEDWLELQHPRWLDDRAAVAAVRRPLELEIP
jgi:hypothetical protein